MPKFVAYAIYTSNAIIEAEDEDQAFEISENLFFTDDPKPQFSNWYVVPCDEKESDESSNV